MARTGSHRPAIALVTCAVATLAAAGCARRAETETLAVATVRQPATSLFFVAQGVGCFAPEHLSIEERTFELGRDALESLRDGHADVAIAYETPLLRAALTDDRLRVLTKLHTSIHNTRLVTRAEAGIRTFADLGGKRISFARGTNADFFTELALTMGSVPRSSAQLVDLSPAASVAALGRGDVDAAVLSDPFAGEAERLLGEGGRTLQTDLYVEASLLITRADVLSSKHHALRALVRGLACAERQAGARPVEARALIRPRFPEQENAALDAQLARVRWGLGLDNVLIDVLRRERDWLAASAPGSKAPALHHLVEPALLDEVSPEAVTLLPTPGALRW